MLVLSRKLGEEVVIGDNIRVTIVAIRGKSVRLGFPGAPQKNHPPPRAGAPPRGRQPRPQEPGRLRGVDLTGQMVKASPPSRAVQEGAESSGGSTQNGPCRAAANPAADR